MCVCVVCVMCVLLCVCLFVLLYVCVCVCIDGISYAYLHGITPVSKAYIPLHQSRRHAMRNCIEYSVRERYRISHGPLFTFLSTELIPDNNLFTKKEKDIAFCWCVVVVVVSE